MDYDEWLDDGDGAPIVSRECSGGEHSRCTPPYLANDWPCECECHGEEML